MANIMGGGEGGFALPLEAWFYEMPIITRCWTTATVITGILVQCQILTPFQVFYSHRAVFSKGQVGLVSTSGTMLMIIVLATIQYICIFWTSISKPGVSPILHATICAHAGGERREYCTLRLADDVRGQHHPRRCTILQSSISRRIIERDTHLHLESTQSRRTAQLLRRAELQGAVAPVGAGRLQCGATWPLAER